MEPPQGESNLGSELPPINQAKDNKIVAQGPDQAPSMTNPGNG